MHNYIYHMNILAYYHREISGKSMKHMTARHINRKLILFSQFPITKIRAGDLSYYLIVCPYKMKVVAPTAYCRTISTPPRGLIVNPHPIPRMKQAPQLRLNHGYDCHHSRAL